MTVCPTVAQPPRAPYIVGTFHPLYHTFKYDTTTPGGATDQLKRDVEAGIKRFTYSNFKVRVQPHPMSYAPY